MNRLQSAFLLLSVFMVTLVSSEMEAAEHHHTCGDCDHGTSDCQACDNECPKLHEEQSVVSADGTVTAAVADDVDEAVVAKTVNHIVKTATCTTDEKEDPRCPSRRHVIACSGQYLDVNKNGLLERSELQAAIDSLPWYARGIINILGSVDKMMGKCDVDGDDAISMDYDMIHNEKTCLATCFKRLAFKKSFFPDCNP